MYIAVAVAMVIVVVLMFILSREGNMSQQELEKMHAEIKAVLNIQEGDTFKLKEYKRQQLKVNEDAFQALAKSGVKKSELSKAVDAEIEGLESYKKLLEESKLAGVKALEAALKQRDSALLAIKEFDKEPDHKADDEEYGRDLMEKGLEASEASIIKLTKHLEELGYQHHNASKRI